MLAGSEEVVEPNENSNIRVGCPPDMWAGSEEVMLAEVLLELKGNNRGADSTMVVSQELREWERSCGCDKERSCGNTATSTIHDTSVAAARHCHRTG